MRRVVINRLSLPTNLPLTPSCVAYLMLEHFEASHTVRVVVGIVLGIWWFGAIRLIGSEKELSTLGEE